MSCSVALVEESGGSPPVNECTVDSDCSEGTCEEGICLSPDSEFSNVLLEIVPNLGVPNVGGLKFFLELDSLEQKLDLELPSISEFVGTVKGTDLVPEACVVSDSEESVEAAADGSLPVRLSLLPRQAVLGLSVSPFTTEVERGSDASYGFEIQVPPGEYDMYIEPLVAEGQCARPPYLALNQVLVPGQVTADLDLPTPERLTIRIEREAGTSSLDGWQVSIVEQNSARRLSNLIELENPIEGPNGQEYEVELVFSPVQGDDSAPATELVRLVPPEDQVAPTIFFQRSVVELFKDNVGAINGLGDLGEPVTYRGSVRAAKGVTEPVPSNTDNDADGAANPPLASSLSTLTFVAQQLARLSDGVTAEFSRIVETDDEGNYEVVLLPGLYTVLVQPMSEGLAQVQLELKVSEQPLEEDSLEVELPERIQLEGEVLSATGEAVPGASVLTVATPATEQDTEGDLATPLLGGPSTVVVRNSQTQSGASGGFFLFADSGAVDLVARSATGSGYPWALDVGYKVTAQTINVGSLRYTEPFLVDGTLAFPNSGVVNGALIRTYAYANESGITDDVETGTRLVQIGESRADESGQFQLYLPSSTQ
jgi:hypothetical protein